MKSSSKYEQYTGRRFPEDSVKNGLNPYTQHSIEAIHTQAVQPTDERKDKLSDRRRKK